MGATSALHPSLCCEAAHGTFPMLAGSWLLNFFCQGEHRGSLHLPLSPPDFFFFFWFVHDILSWPRNSPLDTHCLSTSLNYIVFWKKYADLD